MEFQKPKSLSYRDFFTRKTAVKTSTSESIVEAVIKHQWKSANEACKNHNEVEISGLGKFFVSKPKTLKRISKLEGIQKSYEKILENSNDEEKIRKTKLKLESITKNLEDLRRKLND